MQSLITFQNVSKNYYENKKTVIAINNISFEVFPHEILSILGPSGCGKTTILRLIGDIFKPTSGNIFYKDKDISYARKNDMIGLVPQAPTLLPNRTVGMNISLPLEIKKIDDKELVQKFINLVHLNGFEKFYPHQLSGGMKQKVSIARALVYEPELILMDEPFASLDEIIRENLNIELINIQRRLKSTIIFVTHDVEEAVFISDRIIVMSSQQEKKIGEMKIDLPRDRNNELRNSQEFFNIVKEVRKLLNKSYV